MKSILILIAVLGSILASVCSINGTETDSFCMPYQKCCPDKNGGPQSVPACCPYINGVCCPGPYQGGVYSCCPAGYSCVDPQNGTAEANCTMNKST